jgi:hypothetical protein
MNRHNVEDIITGAVILGFALALSVLFWAAAIIAALWLIGNL